MAAIASYNAQLYITSMPSVSFSNIALTDAGDHKTFSISDQTKRYWDIAQTITVQTSPDGTTWSTVTSGFTIQYVGGKILFSSPVSGGTPSCRVSAYYMPYSFLGYAKNAEVTAQLGIEDVTAFQNPPSAWKTKLATIGETSIKLGKWWIDATFASYLQNRCVVSIYSGANSNQRYECYAFLKQDSIKIAVDKVIEEELDFESDGTLYYIQS